MPIVEVATTAPLEETERRVLTRLVIAKEEVVALVEVEFEAVKFKRVVEPLAKKFPA